MMYVCMFVMYVLCETICMYRWMFVRMWIYPAYSWEALALPLIVLKEYEWKFLEVYQSEKCLKLGVR